MAFPTMPESFMIPGRVHGLQYREVSDPRKNMPGDGYTLRHSWEPGPSSFGSLHLRQLFQGCLLFCGHFCGIEEYGDSLLPFPFTGCIAHPGGFLKEDCFQLFIFSKLDFRASGARFFQASNTRLMAGSLLARWVASVLA